MQRSFSAFFETRQAENFFTKINQRLQRWHTELDNSGTSQRNVEKSKKVDSLLRANKDPDVAAEVYRSVMWVLRFLQLLCENHNLESQLCLRKHGLVQTTLSFVDALCGGLTSGVGFNSLFTSEDKSNLTNQTLISLTEYCQGPCPENQVCFPFTFSLSSHPSA